jgi:hypothetical protein
MEKLDGKKEVYRPIGHIVYYQRNYGEYYFEHASIENGKSKAYMPLSTRKLNQIAMLTAEEKRFEGLGFHSRIPGNVLHFTTDPRIISLTWHVPIKKRKMIYHNKEVEFTFPHLVFHWVGTETLMLFATKNLKDSTLYYAPLPNVYGTNKMCWGNMKPSDYFNADYQKLMVNAEKAVFNSDWNAFMNTECLNGKKSPEFILQESIKKGLSIPKKLYKSSTSLNSLINDIPESAIN